MCFSSFLERKLHFGLQAVQCPKCSASFCLQAAPAWIHLMTLWRGLHWRFAVSARRKWQKVLFQSIDHCSLRWLYCWATYWMLQDTDNMEASCIFSLKVSTFTHLEQCKTSLLTVNKTGIVRLTFQPYLIVNINFTCYPRDSFRQTSADVRSLEQFCINSWQSCYFGRRTLQFFTVNIQATTHRPVAHLGAVGNPCNL